MCEFLIEPSGILQGKLGENDLWKRRLGGRAGSVQAPKLQERGSRGEGAWEGEGRDA